jgi:hypothetical protein
MVVVTAGVGEGEAGWVVAAARVGERSRAAVGSGVSVTAGRGTMVGVDEAALASLKAAPQPLNRNSRLKNKPSNVVFLIISVLLTQ